MHVVPEISGKNLRLRLVTPDDAAFVHGLRVDPSYNAHLSPVTGTIADQRAWIESYKAKEAAGKEAYYIIERLDGHPCGTVRVYGITQDSFTWGSWILNADKPPKAALDSAILVYDIGFGKLQKSKAVFDVRADNERTLRFHRRFGAEQTGSDDENLYFMIANERFYELRDVLSESLRTEIPK
ncbi:GNAT family N-acetyltransferase [Meridianimarinicoccus aquatilis]|uniref:N-acetyltransferase n=1 Tax=Meridianimarinicoccus aquatilis TaxID=2552766 RepID=A0A4R6B023_9RHOB|nr:GNAT family N-acetyltransferase [Fluviibacterium aquatile]TDL90441.1 N-acetyltransferase [Fluviibacterium aquatile]